MPTTKNDIPIAFHFAQGITADAKALGKMIDKLPPEKCVQLKIQRKSNSKRTDSLEQKNEKLKMRRKVGTTICDIKKLFPKTIHAVTLDGFLIKLTLFVFGLQLNKSSN